ncbi:hypothetical protein [Streptomyces sp. NPDC057696]
MRHRKVSELVIRESITVPQTAAFKDTLRTPTEHQVRQSRSSTPRGIPSA